MMFEKQSKIETEGSKATSSAVGNDTSPSSVQAAPGNEKGEGPDQNFSGTEVDPSNPSLDRTSRSVSGKHKTQETRTVEEEGPSSPKRAREEKSD